MNDAGFTTEDVERYTLRLLGKQGPFRPTVRLLERDGRRFVAKDYRACTPLYRWTVGAWNVRRETRALERLDGLDGIPRIEGRVGRWILLLTWFKGRDLGKARLDRQDAAYFDRLMAIVREMHLRGVLHLDLRQRRNVLIRPNGVPAVIDFGASLCVKPGGWLMRRMSVIDASGVLKYKARAAPGSLTPEERAILDRAERRRRLWPFS